MGAHLRHGSTPEFCHRWKLCRTLPALPAPQCHEPHGHDPAWLGRTGRRGPRNANSRSEEWSADEAWHKAACWPRAKSAGANGSPCSHPSPVFFSRTFLLAGSLLSSCCGCCCCCRYYYEQWVYGGSGPCPGLLGWGGGAPARSSPRASSCPSSGSTGSPLLGEHRCAHRPFDRCWSMARVRLPEVESATRYDFRTHRVGRGTKGCASANGQRHGAQPSTTGLLAGSSGQAA